jgi:hypothetical protein
MGRDLDILDNLEVAAPCHVAWESMAGSDQVRFCDQCLLHVYNLSGMSRRQAAALVEQTEGRLCVRFYRRADGTLLTDNCPVGLRAARRRALRLLAGLAGAAAALFGFLLPTRRERTLIMGNAKQLGRAAQMYTPDRQLPQPTERRIFMGRMDSSRLRMFTDQRHPRAQPAPRRRSLWTRRR